MIFFLGGGGINFFLGRIIFSDLEFSLTRNLMNLNFYFLDLENFFELSFMKIEI